MPAESQPLRIRCQYRVQQLQQAPSVRDKCLPAGVEGVHPAAWMPWQQGGCCDITERQAHVSQPVEVRSGETPGSPVGKPPCVIERWGAKRGGATDRSVTSSEACSVVTPARESGTRRSRACSLRAKAMDGIWDPGAGAQEPPGVGGSERPEGCRGNWRGPTRSAAAGGGACLSITGEEPGSARWPRGSRRGSQYC